ncbi:MAG TPA: DUF3794 domain-containing protein [Symbiobacteriaceae bacterium]|nr:DUF3794 domain-containing protein [Symbiobacteriaceae bacterium]
MGESPRYSLTRIVGTGRDEILLCTEIALPRPAALLLEARKTVLIDRTEITPGSILLQGRLRAVWLYQAAELPGSGPVWSTAADIPFLLRISLPDAQPGMDCRVIDAHVTADASEGAGPALIVDRSVIFVSVEVTVREERGGRPPAPSIVQAPTAGTIIGRFGPKDRHGRS